MRVTIRNRRKMSNTTYHRRCSSQGQRFWWLRNKDTDQFVRLPGGPYRGDRDLDVDIELEPGEYVLGTGPNNGFGVREYFRVEEGACGGAWREDGTLMD